MRATTQTRKRADSWRAGGLWAVLEVTQGETSGARIQAVGRPNVNSKSQCFEVFFEVVLSAISVKNITMRII
jgi:hypothetical protein